MKKTNPKGSRNSDNNMSAGVRDEIVDRVEIDYA